MKFTEKYNDIYHIKYTKYQSILIDECEIP
jgi:hypothetical protein